jgi:hypothetical protein
MLSASSVLNAGFSLLLIGQHCLGHFFRYGAFLQVRALATWLEDCANFTPTPEENNQYSANYFSCNTSSKPIDFYQYTIILQLGFAGMTKISRPKLAFTARNRLFAI